MKRICTLLLLLASISPQFCFASGQTPAVAVVFILARTMKCQDDRPELSIPLEQAANVWMQRNRRYVDELKSRPDFLTAIHKLKKELNKDGAFDSATCQTMLDDLRDEKQDLEKIFE